MGKRITVINDAFFDDICAFIYAIGLNKHCDMVTSALGYSARDTARRVTDGLIEWAHQKDLNFKKSMVSQDFYVSEDPRNNPFRSLIDLNFASNLADHLNFHSHSHFCTNDQDDEIKYSKIIWVLGPFSDLARKLVNNTQYSHNIPCIWSSGSSVFNTDSDPFPPIIYIGKGSNAGIDPQATLKVWEITNRSMECQGPHFSTTSVLVSRQPPIQDVYDAIKCIRSDAAKKMKKVLKYSLDNNPGGGFVWDLGCAITQQHPCIIIGSQLYDADYSDDPSKAIKLTQSTQGPNHNVAQVIVVNVSIDKMLQYLVNDLKKCHH
jgi:hypothetical protein